jgi:hypothetical protein
MFRRHARVAQGGFPAAGWVALAFNDFAAARSFSRKLLRNAPLSPPRQISRCFSLQRYCHVPTQHLASPLTRPPR